MVTCLSCWLAVDVPEFLKPLQSVIWDYVHSSALKSCVCIWFSELPTEISIGAHNPCPITCTHPASGWLPSNMRWKGQVKENQFSFHPGENSPIVSPCLETAFLFLPMLLDSSLRFLKCSWLMFRFPPKIYKWVYVLIHCDSVAIIVVPETKKVLSNVSWGVFNYVYWDNS